MSVADLHAASSTLSSNFHSLPTDSRLIPIIDGSLLVSREYALFCGVKESDLSALDRVLRGEQSVLDLKADLVERLKTHGFFGRPRGRKTHRPTVQLQLTNECNLSCAYCCTNSGKPREEELDFDGFARVVRDVHDIFGKGARLSILGGEPLLRPFALDLAELAVSLGLDLTVFTNGLALASDNDLCQRVATLTREGMTLRVSLAGLNPSFCDEVSSARRFEPLRIALQRLSERGGTAALDVMLMPSNCERIAKEFFAFKKALPDAVTLSLGVLYLSGRERGEHLFSTHRNLEDALTRIAFEAGETICGPKRSPVADRRDGCDCAVGMNVHVRSDGMLFPCFKMEEAIGRLGDWTLAGALEKIKAEPHPATTLETCRSCPLATLCGGGCRSENFLYTGTGEPPCGPWRVQVIAELLSEDLPEVVRWPVAHQYQEAKARGIPHPASLASINPSRHLIDV